MPPEEGKRKETCFGCAVQLTLEAFASANDGVFLCPNCEPDYVRCDNCGDTVHSDGAREFQGNPMCGSCFNDSIRACDYCDELYNRDDVCHDLSEYMCDSCAEEYSRCEDCGGTYRLDDMNEDCYCSDCARNKGPIHDYHSGVGPLQFHSIGSSTSRRLYLGVELETDAYPNGYEVQSSTEELHKISEDETLFWLEHDCSLDMGFELITHPCTLKYHREVFPWANIIRIISNHHGRAARTETAALHVHFNRDFFNGKQSELYQLRLVYLFEKFRDELARLGRTSEYLLRRSAKKYDCSLRDKPAKAKIKQLEENCDRLYAVNLTNRHTIEIRIFRSTIKYSTLLSSLELVDFLVRLAKKVSTKKLQKLTWEELLQLISKKQYHYLPTYAAYCQEHPRKSLEGKKDSYLVRDDSPAPPEIPLVFSMLELSR